MLRLPHTANMADSWRCLCKFQTPNAAAPSTSASVAHLCYGDYCLGWGFLNLTEMQVVNTATPKPCRYYGMATLAFNQAFDQMQMHWLLDFVRKIHLQKLCCTTTCRNLHKILKVAWTQKQKEVPFLAVKEGQKWATKEDWGANGIVDPAEAIPLLAALPSRLTLRSIPRNTSRGLRNKYQTRNTQECACGIIQI